MCQELTGGLVLTQAEPNWYTESIFKEDKKVVKMKKLFAMLAALVLMMTAVSAMAETRTYITTAIRDTDGNTMALDESFFMIFACDDETYECVFSLNDMEPVGGTFEIVGQDDQGTAILNCTLANGGEMVMNYIGEGYYL